PAERTTTVCSSRRRSATPTPWSRSPPAGWLRTLTPTGPAWSSTWTPARWPAETAAPSSKRARPSASTSPAGWLAIATSRWWPRVSGPDRRRPRPTHHPGLADASAPAARRRLPVPRLRPQALATGPPREALDGRRPHRPGQPSFDLQTTPQAGPRVRLDGGTRPRRPRHLSPAERPGLQGRAA